mgnify:CR=1 FL=1|jgi:hypothetical protein
MLTHIQSNKNIYIAIGVIGLMSTVAYLSIQETFNFKKRSEDDE